MKLTEKISWLLGRVQRSLFPHLNECLPTPLTEQEKRLVAILEIVEVERHVPRIIIRYQYPSRKPLDRQALARALVAEYLSHELIGHISRDSTAIVGCEKPAKKAAKVPKPRRKRGRPAKGEQREPVEMKRLEPQTFRSAEEAAGKLPTVCDRGTKQNAKGYKTSWSGYKLHLDTNDDIGLPISALVTSASLHDSQVAIPLIKMTSTQVTYLYDLMEAAYDALLIEEASRKLGHVPIADRNGRGKEIVPMAPHEAERYKIRSCAERANSRLKEDFGANNVKGAY